MSGLDFQDINVDDIGGLNSPFTSATEKNFNPFLQNSDISGNINANSNIPNNSEANQPNFFSFKFYQRYFDVDTDQVKTRILHSFLPIKNSNFINDHIQPIPDLYGPFWICVTLIFSIAIFGNFAHYIQNSGVSRTYENDFGLVTSATTLISIYVFFVPFIIYSFIWKRKSFVQYSYFEIVCAYGYSLAIFIPVSMFWIIQIQLFRWLLILISVVSSGIVLINSFWPIVKDDLNRLLSFGFIAFIIVSHSLLAIAFKQLYFDTSMPNGLNFNNLTPLTSINNTTVRKINAIKVVQQPSIALNQMKIDYEKNLDLNNSINNKKMNVSDKPNNIQLQHTITLNNSNNIIVSNILKSTTFNVTNISNKTKAIKL